MSRIPARIAVFVSAVGLSALSTYSALADTRIFNVGPNTTLLEDFTGRGDIDATIRGEHINTSIYSTGDASLDFDATGSDQLNILVTGLCPTSAPPIEVDRTGSGLKLEIATCGH